MESTLTFEKFEIVFNHPRNIWKCHITLRPKMWFKLQYIVLIFDCLYHKMTFLLLSITMDTSLFVSGNVLSATSNVVLICDFVRLPLQARKIVIKSTGCELTLKIITQGNSFST